jgi:ribonuclease-3
MFENHIEELEKVIGHRFQRENIHLLEEARTTMAYHNEHKDVKHQEVLAKLGDAVLKPVIVANLIAAGAKTAKEINDSQQILECRKNLAGTALKMGIAEHLNLGAGESDSKQTDHKNALGESLEAIIGAIYLDAGFERCKKVVLSWKGM